MSRRRTSYDYPCRNEPDAQLGRLHRDNASYYAHKQEIDQRTAEDEAFAEEMRRKNPSKLQEKLDELRKAQ